MTFTELEKGLYARLGFGLLCLGLGIGVSRCNQPPSVIAQDALTTTRASVCVLLSYSEDMASDMGELAAAADVAQRCETSAEQAALVLFAHRKTAPPPGASGDGGSGDAARG